MVRKEEKCSTVAKNAMEKVVSLGKQAREKDLYLSLARILIAKDLLQASGLISMKEQEEVHLSMHRKPKLNLCATAPPLSAGSLFKGRPYFLRH